MGPPDEPAGQEDVLEGVVAGPAQQGIARPGVLAQEARDGPLAQPPVDLGKLGGHRLRDLGGSRSGEPALGPEHGAREAPRDVRLAREELGRGHVGRERHGTRRLAHGRHHVGGARGDQRFHRRLRRLEVVAGAGAESRHRLGERPVALDTHARRIHAVAAEHGEHALPGRRGLREGEHGLADEVAEAEAEARARARGGRSRCGCRPRRSARRAAPCDRPARSSA